MSAASVIDEEVARFDALGEDWWDPAGPMAPLHRMNPIRIGWLRDSIARHFGRTAQADAGPLTGLTLLDIGCGAGLLSEPLSRLGAEVTGLDPAPASRAVARAHAEETLAPATYRQGTLEEMAAEGARFDVVLAMEVVEHVADPKAFIALAAQCLKPGGIMALSTLNRTFKSFALAIVGAEYVLRWLAPGTHRWEQFVTPEELKLALEAADLTVGPPQGFGYNPLRQDWKLTRNTEVNYAMTATLRSLP